MSLNQLDERAREILRDNDHGDYTVPTHGLYPYQWNWDSAFAAFGFATFDPQRAWKELHTLTQAQWSNGMIPHIIFHRDDPGYFPGPDVWATNKSPATSGISQPPVAATFARSCYKADPEHGKQHLAKLYPKLLSWHRWFKDNRCESGAVAITHPWEAGRDNAPDWDEPMANIDTSHVGEYTRRDTGHVDSSMRPTKEDYDRYMTLLYFSRDCQWDENRIRENALFRVADPSMTFILLRANRDLKAIAIVLDEPFHEIDQWIAQLEQGVQTLWNPELQHYDSKDLITEKFTNSLSCASFLCWYAGIESKQMCEHLKSIWNSVEFGLPSYTPEGSKFDHLRYWRGPVWPIVNTLIGIGLEEMGYSEFSNRLKSETRALIEKSGFNEYFSALDGTPAGGKDFTWTAAVWLGWLNTPLSANSNNLAKD